MIKEPYRKRLQKAREMMEAENLDLLLVNNRENLIYFTGLTQIECLAVLIPRQGEPCAVTLWLDAGYVGDETGIKTYGYAFPGGNLAETIIERIRAYGYSQPSIGFERYFIGFSVYDLLRRHFPEKGFRNAGELFYRLRAVKDNAEIEYMRRAGRIAVQGMAAAAKTVAAGASELDVLAEAEYAMTKAGSGGSPFRPQVVSGSRSLLTHPCAGSKTIEKGEIVVIHLGATYEGYCAKLCRTAAVGDIGNGRRAVYALLLKAQEAAIKALRPGVGVDEVDAAARRVIEESGYAKSFLDIIGYGVGIRQSEFYPILGKGRKEHIEAGMVVDLLLPTIYRQDIGGPRVTDCIYVADNGVEVLTGYPRDLIEVL